MNENNSTAANKEIGHRIKNRRIELGLTLKEVADRVGVASSTIQRYENGTISQIKLPVLQAIASALEIEPISLIKKISLAPEQIKIFDNIQQLEFPLNGSAVTQEYVFYQQNFNADTFRLIKYYSSLNDTGKKEALKRLHELTIIYGE